MSAMFTKKIISLKEDLAASGIDSDSFFGEINRNVALLERGSTPNVGKVRSPMKDEMADDDACDDDEESAKVPSKKGKSAYAKKVELSKKEAKDPEALAAWVARQELAKWDAKGKAEGFDVLDVLAILKESDGLSEADISFLVDMADVDEDGAMMGEALRIVKLKRKTASERNQEKRERKKHRGSIKRAAKMYYKRNRRKIAKKLKRLRKKFGGSAGLAAKQAALSQGHKRLQMAGVDELSNLREELAQATGIQSASADMRLYEEAVIRAGLLSMRLGEVFEMSGDTDSAEILYRLSDMACDLSESVMGLEQEEVSEKDTEEFGRILAGVSKAMQAYEGMESPSIWDMAGQ